MISLSSSVLLPWVNHLIAAEKWAHDLLLNYEGKVVQIEMPFLKLNWVVRDSFFETVSQEQIPSVSIQVTQDAVWAFLKDGKPAAMKFVKISGDVDFAASLNRLVADLKWEAEEDLAKLIGDGPSHLIFKETKKVLEQSKKASEDLRVGVLDYLVTERKVLVSKQEFDSFKSDLRVTRDHLDRVEKLVTQLSQRFENKVSQ